MKRTKVSLWVLPSNRSDIVSLFESMTPYFDSDVQPTGELLQLMVEGINKSLYTFIFDFADPWKAGH